MLGPHPPGPEPLAAVTGTRPEQAKIRAASPGPQPVGPVPGALPARWHEAPRTQHNIRPQSVNLGSGVRGAWKQGQCHPAEPLTPTPLPRVPFSPSTRMPGCLGWQWGKHGEQGRHTLQPSPGLPRVTAGPSLICQGQGSPEQGSMAAPQSQQCLEARGATQGAVGGGVWVKVRAQSRGRTGGRTGPWQDMVAHGCCAAEGKLLPSEGCRLHAGFGWFQRQWTKPWDPHPVLSPPQPGAPQLKPRSGPPEMFCLALLTDSCPGLPPLPLPCLPWGLPNPWAT